MGDSIGPRPQLAYWHLWTGEDGITHQTECRLTEFDIARVGAAAPQWNNAQRRGEAEQPLRQLDKVLSEFREGGRKLWSGPIRGQDGSIIVPAGTVMPPEDVSRMSFFVEGVVGSLPDRVQQLAATIYSPEAMRNAVDPRYIERCAPVDLLPRHWSAQRRIDVEIGAADP